MIQSSPRGGASTGSIHSGSGPFRLGRRPARYAPTKKNAFDGRKGNPFFYPGRTLKYSQSPNIINHQR